jgi:hypothetical protein
VRIWEELALASDGSSRLRREIIPALLGRDYLFVRNMNGEDLGGGAQHRRLLSSPQKKRPVGISDWSFFCLENNEGSWEELAQASDGSSRLRQKMAPPIWVGPFLLRRVVRIWERIA